MKACTADHSESADLLRKFEIDERELSTYSPSQRFCLFSFILHVSVMFGYDTVALGYEILHHVV